MKNSEKKELAKQLFLHTTLNQNEIAEKVHTTPKTMGKWCKEWRVLKAAISSTKDHTIARLYGGIDLILKAAEDEKRPITDAEADKISKINKTIGTIDKDLDLAIYIQVFEEYNRYLMPLNTDLTRENNVYQDKFISIKAGVSN